MTREEILFRLVTAGFTGGRGHALAKLLADIYKRLPQPASDDKRPAPCEHPQGYRCGEANASGSIKEMCGVCGVVLVDTQAPKQPDPAPAEQPKCPGGHDCGGKCVPTITPPPAAQGEVTTTNLETTLQRHNGNEYSPEPLDGCDAEILEAEYDDIRANLARAGKADKAKIAELTDLLTSAEAQVELQIVRIAKLETEIAAWFSTFFEKAFVRRVNRRMDMRIVRFWRSM